MEKRLQRRWRGRKTRRVWHRESWVKCFKRESWSCGQENYEYTDSIVCSFIVYISTLVILMISLSVEGCGRSHNVVAKDWAGSQNLPQGGMATVQGGLRIWARFLRQLYVCVCICLCLLCCFVTFLLKGAILNYWDFNPSLTSSFYFCGPRSQQPLKPFSLLQCCLDLPNGYSFHAYLLICLLSHWCCHSYDTTKNSWYFMLSLFCLLYYQQEYHKEKYFSASPYPK